MRLPACRLAPLALLAGASALAAPVPPPKPRPGGAPLTCVLKGPATCKLGEVPDVSVRLINRSGREVLLVGSLDGSDMTWRYPHCYFEVTRPDGRPAPTHRNRCGFMNSLREKDFVAVKAGGSFDPYQRVDNRGFFSASHMDTQTFSAPGKYRIRFVYSTDSPKWHDWWSNGPDDEAGRVKLAPLLARVPRVTVKSNEIVVEVK